MSDMETTVKIKKSAKEPEMVDLFKSVVNTIKKKGLIPGFAKAKKEVALIADSLAIGMEEAYMLPLLFETHNVNSLEYEYGIEKLDFMFYVEAVNKLSYEGLVELSMDGQNWSVPNSIVRGVLRETSKSRCDYGSLTAEQLARRVEDCIPKRMEPVPVEDRVERFKYLLNRLKGAGNPLLESVLENVNTNDELHNRYCAAMVLLMLNNAICHGNLFCSSMLNSFAKSLDNRFKELSPTMFSKFMAFLEPAGVVELEDSTENRGPHYRIKADFARKFHFNLPRKKTIEQLYARTPAISARMDAPEGEGRETPAYITLEHEKILEKKLYYNAAEQDSVNRLAGILDEAKLKKVQNRLESLGRKGFVCLFYGAPGTGKTETCLQLAKKSHRDLLSMDVSQIKSRWMGESEKNLRGVFKSYNAAIEKAKEENRPFPILLLNEADSLVTKRVSVVQSSDQVQNSLQNILLQEFETTEGIIICTTNLTSNMDDAFERRFLYKVEFNRPDADVRTRIWHDKLNMLSEEECAWLGTDYDFSGGEIENVTRKAIIDSALEDEDVAFANVVELADQERLKSRENHKKVGFVA